MSTLQSAYAPTSILRNAGNRPAWSTDTACQFWEKYEGCFRNPVDSAPDPVDGIPDPVDGVSNLVDGVSDPVDGIPDAVDRVSDRVDHVSDPVDGILDAMDGVWTRCRRSRTPSTASRSLPSLVVDARRPSRQSLHPVKAYLDVVREVLDHGTFESPNHRTFGVDTLSTFNWNYEVDLREGFPLLTTKNISWKNIVVENLWFLSGDPSITLLQKHKCKFWDPWADADGRVPSAYGDTFWRRFPVRTQAPGRARRAPSSTTRSRGCSVKPAQARTR